MSHYDDASKVIPNGSLTRSKAPGRFYPTGAGPHYAVRGRGAKIHTADGDELIDMLCALGAISLGYGVTGLNAYRAVDDGMTYSLPSVLEAQAARVMLDDVAPWAERVKFCKTGSESTHAAYRIAKHATGRPLVVVLEGSYHGWYEWSWRTGDIPDSPFTILAPYGACLADWLAAQQIDPARVAAVFVEPHRWQPTSTDWLRNVREVCAAQGIVLVFDSMIYGGRWSLGGASDFFRIVPDMECFGKALGNGAAIAAVVGSADLLEQHGGMVSGTFSGDTVGLASFLDTVAFYRHSGVIDHLWLMGGRLVGGLQGVCGRHPSLGAEVQGAAPVHLRVAFREPGMGHEFSRQMVLRDVLWHPDCANVMWSHTSALIDQVVQAADDSMAAMENA